MRGRTRPSAVTTSAPTRLSEERPARRVSQPRPPPRVRPATPVWLMKPPGTASPCSCVAASSSAHVVPPPQRRAPRARVDGDRLHRRQVDHQPAVGECEAGDSCGPRRGPRPPGRHSLANASAAATSPLRRAAGHDRRPATNGAVPDVHGLVVPGLARSGDRSREPAWRSRIPSVVMFAMTPLLPTCPRTLRLSFVATPRLRSVGLPTREAMVMGGLRSRDNG